jgi:hypothetical protein
LDDVWIKIAQAEGVPGPGMKWDWGGQISNGQIATFDFSSSSILLHSLVLQLNSLSFFI